MTMAPTDAPDDSTIVKGDVPAESTVPEPAPARRPAPVAAPPPVRNDRQRRLTVASPIPALLAASMREGGPGEARKNPARPSPSRPSPSRAEAVPVATGSAQTTSRLAEDLQSELLRDDDEDPEYIVEIDASTPNCG